MTRQTPRTDHLTRRTALTGAATLGVGVPLLAACGAGEETVTDTSSSAASPSGSPSAPGEAAGESSSAGGGSTSGLASTSDIEVGGGEIFSDEEVVLVQPTEGEFRAFSAVCTHQGCLVSEVTSAGILCACHNSVFSLEDGSPTSGPAQDALSSVDVKVEGDQIVLA